MRPFIALLLSLLLLSACSAPDDEYQIPAQKWEDVVVLIQGRPAVVTVEIGRASCRERV